MRWLTQDSAWVILTGLIPVALAGAVIEILVAPELVDLLTRDLAQGVASSPPYVEGVIFVSTLAICYLSLCIALLGYYCAGFARSALPRPTKLRLAATGIAAWFVFLCLLIGSSQLDLQIYSIAYGSILAIYQQAGDPVAGAMTGAVAIPGVSRHLLSVVLPTAGGVAAVCAASCHGIALVDRARTERGRAKEVVDDLVRSIMAMSGLLVGSTLLIALYLRLPASLYGVGEIADQRVSAYLDFANAVTILWGTILVLTLAALYLPHALAVRSLAGVSLGQILTASEERAPSRWGFLKKLEVAVAAVAPLLAALATTLT